MRRFFRWSVPQRRAPLPGSRRKHAATSLARSSAFAAAFASSSLSSLSVWYQLREAISVHWLTRPSPMTGVGRRRSCNEVVGCGGLCGRPLNQSGTPTASRQNASRQQRRCGDGPRGSARGFLARRIGCASAALTVTWRLVPVGWQGCRGALAVHLAICAVAQRRRVVMRARVAGVQSAVLAKCRQISRSGRQSGRMALGSPVVSSTGSSVAK